MGFELIAFVHPERISSQLICPICTLVLENPVLTEYEHLYCESCLIEWLLIKEICPMTHKPLQLKSIRKPGRIITNMLGELERYCCYRSEGCIWYGEQNNYEVHVEQCSCRSKSVLLNEIEHYKNMVSEYNIRNTENTELIGRYKRHVRSLEQEVGDCKAKIENLEDIVLALNAKLKIYDKAHNSFETADDEESDLIRLTRLRKLSVKVDESKSNYRGR
jgi:hypothetical protein